MAVLSLLLILAIAGQQIRLALAASSTTLKVVNLGYAMYQSDLSLEDGITSFLGVRYAAPPTGKSSSASFLVAFFSPNHFSQAICDGEPLKHQR